MALTRSWRSRRAARVGVAAASSWSCGDRNLIEDALYSFSARCFSGGTVVKHVASAKTGPTFSAAPIVSENLLHVEADNFCGEVAKLSFRDDTENSELACRVCNDEHRSSTSSEEFRLRRSSSGRRNRWIVTKNSNFGANLPGELRNYTTGRSFSPSWQRRCEALEGVKHGAQSQQFPKFLFQHVQIRSHVGHAHPHESAGGREKEGQDVLGLGLWGDVVLAIGKGGAGYLSGSKALLADAAHSVSDVALSAVALWTSKIAYAPKDKQHPYGHGKYESVGALGISGVLLLTGVGIAWQSIETLQPFVPILTDWIYTSTHDHHHGQMQEGDGHHHGIDLQHPYVALTAAVLSIGVKEILYWRTRRVGLAQNNELLKASAWHHRSDAISSVVALLGVGGSIMGLPLLDPVAGIVVSGMIAKAGLESGYQSLQDLVDSGMDESVLSPIRNTVLNVQGVQGCHHLRGRKMGSAIHVDAHIEVDPWLSVSAAHNIAEIVRHQLQHDHPEVGETFVHIEPADGGTKILTEDEAQIEHDHHDQSRDTDKHEGQANEYLSARKDLTKEGSKSELIQQSVLNENCTDDSFDGEGRQHGDLDHDVRHIVGTDFREKMTINHVTSHFLHGKVVVEVEVSMDPDISVRNAMDVANDAERAILERVPEISAVRVQLKLSKGLHGSA